MWRRRCSARTSNAAPTSATSTCSPSIGAEAGLSDEHVAGVPRHARRRVGARRQRRAAARLRRAHGAEPAVRRARAGARHGERGDLRARARPGAVSGRRRGRPRSRRRTERIDPDDAGGRRSGGCLAVRATLRPHVAAAQPFSSKANCAPSWASRVCSKAPRCANARAALWHGRVDAELLVRPRNTEQVSAILRLCHARGQPVVTHGGLTGLVNGADAGRGEIVLSLESMNAIERVDVSGRSLRAQAGAKLGQVQRAAEEHGLVFPLDLGARDSATVGGNISTNAGGLRVLRYGMMRNLVLGIEAVLADGTVLTSLNRMLKNNAGYDLKQLFIGSEGTLGVVTRAELRLVSRTRSQETLLAATAEFRCARGVARSAGFRARRTAGGIRGAVGQLLRLQHDAARAERGAAGARRAVLRDRGNAGRRSGRRSRAARNRARRGARGGRGDRRHASRIRKPSGAPSGTFARTSGR